ncbi:MAG: gliding motility-associated C-terminal domain-containing protein [Bacteroidetes bacterium]|nr:gliding motility-associated C-terminal domain-containing protein [Bacteroidota bacterium]
MRIFIFCFLPSAFCHLNAQSFVPLSANAGNNTGICPNDSVQIGGNPSATGGTPLYTYSWQPTSGLDFPNSPNPNAFPSTPTDYTLTVTDAVGNSSVDIIFVDTFPLPNVSAGPDMTIIEGTNTQLLGSGAVNYYWYPWQTLYNQNSANPIAEPSDTTIYCVGGVDGNGCANYDCMVLFVIPSDELVVYNAFTPNGDGLNDVFYIGNIQKYPESKFEVFNRNGKLVYQASPYLNDWNGRVDGVDLPCATYYYVLSPGSGKSKMQGAVTIIR